jgi:phage shock protein C
MNRRLTRCRENRMLLGVAGGVAEYFAIDASLVRLLWLASIFFGGVGIFLYIAMAIIVPLEPLSADAAAAHAVSGAGAAGHLHRAGAGTAMTFVGVVLLLVGGIALLNLLLPGWATWRQLWPLLFVGSGAFLVFTAARRARSEELGAATPPTPAAPISPCAPAGPIAPAAES